MSHASHHNVLTGSQQVKDRETYSNIVSVRSDKVDSWKKEGYEIIEDSDDSCLMGKKKTNAELNAEKKDKEVAAQKAKEAEDLKAKQEAEQKLRFDADRKREKEESEAKEQARLEKENKDKEVAEWLAAEAKAKAEAKEETKTP